MGKKLRFQTEEALKTLLVYEMFYSLSSLHMILCLDMFWRPEAFEITISKVGQGSLEKWS